MAHRLSADELGHVRTYTVKTPDTFATDAIIKGDEVIIYQECFAYRTFTQPKHTAFCFFYKQGLTKAPNLNICESGNEAN